MAQKQSPTQRVSDQMASELTAQTPRLISKLQSDFQGSDRSNASTPVWHSIIRQNWQDPMWRQQQAVRLGPVPFVQDALAAFGLPTNGLKNLPPTPTPDPSAPPQPLPPTAPPPEPLA